MASNARTDILTFPSLITHFCKRAGVLMPDTAPPLVRPQGGIGITNYKMFNKYITPFQNPQEVDAKSNADVQMSDAPSVSRPEMPLWAPTLLSHFDTRFDNLLARVDNRFDTFSTRIGALETEFRDFRHSGQHRSKHGPDDAMTSQPPHST
ncbi:hypothetical protein L2E82_12059 [Cichorium intybus]|uniref:Uncharacterized protein n=1 Tax=Cichorium intybus TaxID=13427 RepID=A0ACB9GG47_CICIN|nr:hypothetical protein L2E82_12059 [Cichorium intybus]